MCRIPKVMIVAAASRHLELRRLLSSLEYDIVATVEPGELTELTADVAVICEPVDEAVVDALRRRSTKIVAAADPPVDGADLVLSPAELSSFRGRVLELFRATP